MPRSSKVEKKPKALTKKKSSSSGKKASLVSEKSEKNDDKKKAIKKESTKNIKSLKPEKKAKPVIVDIINDDEEDTLDVFRSSAPVDIFAEEFNDENSDDNDLIAAAEKMFKVNNETINEDEIGVVSKKAELRLQEEEIDNQKKFFQELSLEIENRKKEETKKDLESNFNEENLVDFFAEDLVDDDFVKNKKEKKGKEQGIKQRSIGLYSRFVWRFFLVVGFLAALVFYLSFSKLNIKITPKSETLNENMLLKVSALENENALSGLLDPRENLFGEVQDFSLSFEQEFPASGEEFVGEAVSGRVKIINNYSRAQALVVTTRLLSPDNKLFRIKDAVNVPAGGEVWVDVYVDKPSREFAINPTTFTIPGLWVGLQDQIYAKSEEAFVFEQKKEKYIRASDIAGAKTVIYDEFLKRLEADIEKEKEILNYNGEDWGSVYLLDSNINIQEDSKVDTKVENFKVSISGQAKVAFFRKNDLANLALGKLNLLIPDDKELVEFNSSQIILNFETYDEKSNTATVKASFSGKMILKSDEEPVKRESLINLDESQIVTYLQSQPEVKSFELKFYPGFVKKAPRLVDRINIELIKE